MMTPRIYSYPAVLEPGENPGVYVVTFPDVPEAITEGDGREDALARGRDALGTALLALLALKRPVPRPSLTLPGSMVSVAADVAAKIAVIEAFQDAQITQLELGKRMGKDGREIRRILSPTHSTKLPALQEALEALGRRLVVSVEAA